jgi:hypothetical protein
LIKTALSDDLEHVALGVIELDIAEICTARFDVVCQNIVEGHAEILGRQQTRAESMEPADRLQFCDHRLFTQEAAHG